MNDTKYGKQIAEGKSRAEVLYGDIIDLPHYEPKKHERMDLYKRAAQFAPFAALTGYGDAIDEVSRYTDQGMELSEDEKDRLDYLIRTLMQDAEEEPEVSLIHYVPDERKSGGSFKETAGRVKKIDTTKKALIMEDGQMILIEQIIDMRT